MIALKKASKWNPIDLVAAKTIRERCGGGWIKWASHVEWWFQGGYERCWFVTVGFKRIAYGRVDKGGYVSLAVLEPWRGSGLGQTLLREIRWRVDGILLAVIKRENVASRATFFRAGYTYLPSEKSSEYVLMQNKGGI